MSRLFADLRTRLLPITLTQLVGLACGIAGVKLSSQLIAPADFGRYGVFLTFTPLGMSVVHAGLAKFTARHWAGADDKSLLWREIIRPASAKLPWLLLAAALAALLMAGREWLGLLPFIFFAAAFLSYGSLAQVALQADRRHWADFFISAVGSPTRSFLPPLFYWASGGTMVALYGGYTLHALAFAAIALWILPARARPQPIQPAIPTLLPAVYAGPMFNLLAVTGWTLTGLNRWLVALFFGVTTTGYFTLANNIAMIVPAMLGAMLTQYFQPVFFAAPHATAEERRSLAHRVDRVASLFWLTALGGLVALRFAMPWLTGTLIDAKYSEAGGFVLPAGCFFVATITAQFYHQLLLAGNRESACGPVDLIFAGCLTAGCLVAAVFGLGHFTNWLMLTPALPWLLSRPLARHYLFKPVSA